MKSKIMQVGIIRDISRNLFIGSNLCVKDIRIGIDVEKQMSDGLELNPVCLFVRISRCRKRMG